MMTVHKLSAGDGYTYLTRHVASHDQDRSVGQDLAGYYTATGNPPGRWLGAGAADLGMSGPVSEAHMVALFGKGLHPDAEQIAALERATGAPEWQVDQAVRLGRPFPVYPPADPRRAVAGYDLVFTPVKSASVLWALGNDEVRRQVEAAHREAVVDTVGWLERHAAFTRMGAGGLAQVETYGLLCAAFEHRDSRLGDPDLHTHVAVANKVRARVGRPDGGPRWLALDGRALYQAGVAASERYNTRLEDGLARRLGVRFVERPDSLRRDRRPVREVAGMPLELIRTFSQRRAVIENRYDALAADYRRKHGREPSRATQVALAQQATLDTRTGKPPPRALADQLADWRSRAADVLGAATARRLGADVTGHHIDNTDPGGLDVEQLAARVVSTVEGERSTWSRWNVLAEVERQTRGLRFATAGERDAVVVAVLQTATGPAQAIRIEPPGSSDEMPGPRRSDGISVFQPHAAERYTTARILHAEQALLAAADEHTGQAVEPSLVDRCLDLLAQHTGRPLDDGQTTLVHSFTADDRRLVVGIGPAGSGKTTTMRAACAAWDAAGRRVVPLASSATAADVLGSDLGRRAENLHKFLHELDGRTTRGPGPADPADRAFFTLHHGDVLLVDEAGMAGTGQLHRLLCHAQATGAMVRLLGDPHQLAAVESGGALRLLAADTRAVELTALHRFADPAAAHATLALRHGDPTGLDFYAAAGRIRSGTRPTMVDAAFAGWRADMLAGRITMMAAADKATVAELAARARLDRIGLGAVEVRGVRLHDGNRAGVGDWIVTRANDRLLTTHGGRDFVKNGDLWQVLCRHDDGALTVRHLRHCGRVRLPAGYVAGDVELGYAATAHRAQGDTVDTAHPVITEQMSREALYVLASRARHETTLYVVCDQLVDIASEHAPPARRTARQVLEGVLAHESAERSATETLRAALGARSQFAFGGARPPAPTGPPSRPRRHPDSPNRNPDRAGWSR